MPEADVFLHIEHSGRDFAFPNFPSKPGNKSTPLLWKSPGVKPLLDRYTITEMHNIHKPDDIRRNTFPE